MPDKISASVRIPFPKLSVSSSNNEISSTFGAVFFLPEKFSKSKSAADPEFFSLLDISFLSVTFLVKESTDRFSAAGLSSLKRSTRRSEERRVGKEC